MDGYMDGQNFPYCTGLASPPVHCGPEQPKIQTKKLGHSLVPSLIHLHHSLVELARPCWLCSRSPLCSLVRSLAYFAHSQVCGTVNDWMAIYSVFFSILVHSAASSGAAAPKNEIAAAAAVAMAAAAVAVAVAAAVAVAVAVAMAVAAAMNKLKNCFGMSSSDGGRGRGNGGKSKKMNGGGGGGGP